MNWESLLSTTRYKQESVNDKIIDRSAFEKDFDRIVFSSSFRKLQDKTQVIPFPINDFVHSRLTHSLEVSCVGRSLGKIIGQHIMDLNPSLKEMGYDASAIGSLVAAASLAHDIGNPPFGHSGENAFRSFFQEKGKKYQSEMSEIQWSDFTNYEGNANGFRILTNLNQPGGLRLTSATLAAFTKYPTSSKDISNKKLHLKKCGYFEAEKDLFEKVASDTKLGKTDNHYHRHPLAFLMEAADDICYSIIDFEDGLRLGLIEMTEAYELFKSLLGDQLNLQKLKTISSVEEQAGLMRALAINKLTTECAKIFMANQNAILQGTFNTSLIKESPNISIVKSIKDLSIQKVYQSEKVLTIEATGFEVIEGLLDIFVSAIQDDSNSFRSKKLMQLLPAQFQQIHDKTTYQKILSICDFISGLSDSQALGLFRKLKGIEIPY